DPLGHCYRQRGWRIGRPDPCGASCRTPTGHGSTSSLIVLRGGGGTIGGLRSRGGGGGWGGVGGLGGRGWVRCGGGGGWGAGWEGLAGVCGFDWLVEDCFCFGEEVGEVFEGCCFVVWVGLVEESGEAERGDWLAVAVGPFAGFCVVFVEG